MIEVIASLPNRRWKNADASHRLTRLRLGRSSQILHARPILGRPL